MQLLRSILDYIWLTLELKTTSRKRFRIDFFEEQSDEETNQFCWCCRAKRNNIKGRMTTDASMMLECEAWINSRMTHGFNYFTTQDDFAKAIQNWFFRRAKRWRNKSILLMLSSKAKQHQGPLWSLISILEPIAFALMQSLSLRGVASNPGTTVCNSFRCRSVVTHSSVFSSFFCLSFFYRRTP